MSEHTPTPWVSNQIGDGSTDATEARAIWTKDEEVIVCVMKSEYHVTHVPARPVCNANAAFIVRACNSHDALLAACKAALTQLTDLDDVLNQPNLSVVGWHLNGDHEPCVNFFAENDHGAIEKLKAAIAADAEGSGT